MFYKKIYIFRPIRILSNEKKRENNKAKKNAKEVNEILENVKAIDFGQSCMICISFHFSYLTENK